MKTQRIFLIVLDSVGAGALPDAAAYGDEGANTLGHIVQQAAPRLPNLYAMGLGRIPGVGGLAQAVSGAYGRAAADPSVSHLSPRLSPGGHRRL